MRDGQKKTPIPLKPMFSGYSLSQIDRIREMFSVTVEDVARLWSTWPMTPRVQLAFSILQRVHNIPCASCGGGQEACPVCNGKVRTQPDNVMDYTQAEIAFLCACSREKVTRAVAALRKRRLVEKRVVGYGVHTVTLWLGGADNGHVR